MDAKFLAQNVVISKAVYDQLYLTGKQDRANGLHYSTGWGSLCKDLGFSTGRTPAREAYEDGFFSGK